ncbi:uncharacterized protein CG3556-like [Argiope bruennichi]|uniref:Uncharacterized protein n=1 Tax=Argiope bruennichi TaxID=94029 RepID=A0A8T0EN53_ARGBR|nr:uncharacterized protein CG3556-like [Argiope bruennichi]KAF8776888.1 hypothetical protein HNY73_013826 [Argiope bruennichi]
MNWLTFVLVLLTFATVSYAKYGSYDDFDDPSEANRDWGYRGEGTPAEKPNVCVSQPLGGIDWILSVRQPDYGWREETHRAVIVLAVNNWKHLTPQEIQQMELQLEVELTKALLRNHTFELHPNDLALYIHALIATKRNPRNFYGIDLVSRLSHLVSGSYYQVHPFLLLALCNANEKPKHTLSFAQWMQQNRHFGKDNLEYMALALNAFECLKTLNYPVDERFMNDVRHSIAAHQLQDGSFGNVYTTALVVQALASSPNSLDWNKQRALVYLRSQSTVDLNMISTYLIELALNSDRIKFIKDLHRNLDMGPAPERRDRDHYFVQYTVRVEENPDVYFTISIKVPPASNFYYIMNESAKHDAKFNFSSYADKNGNPVIYSIAGVPNDAEENLYWRLCLQTDVNHNRHDAVLKTIYDSPISFVPKGYDHIIYWYKNRECEET